MSKDFIAPIQVVHLFDKGMDEYRYPASMFICLLSTQLFISRMSPPRIWI